MLDEYTDEFGTNLENRIPEFNAQGFVDPYQQQRQSAPLFQPQPAPYPYQQPQPPQPQPQTYQPPIYQQYVYQPAAPVAPSQPEYRPQQRQAAVQDRINNVFAEESQELNNLLKAENNTGCLKNLLFLLICCLVVAGSFGLSYLIGAKMIGQQNIVPSFSVTSGVKKIKNLMDGSDIVKNERAFMTYTVQATHNVILPPEVQYAPPPPPPVQPKPPVVPAKPAQPTGTMYRVVVGNYSTKQEASDVAVSVRADGFPVYMYQAEGKYRLQIGAFKSKSLASALMKKAGDYGYNAYLSIK